MTDSGIEYHAPTLALLGRSPRVCPTATAAIAHAERRLRSRLPEALRQWFALEDSTALLTPHGEGDPTVGAHELGLLAGDSPGDNRWVVRAESQGVCCWAVEFDGSPDPPVVVSLDLLEWTPATERFSQLLHAAAWDEERVLRGDWVVQAQMAPLRATVLEQLGRQFLPGVVTRGYPGRVQHRFESTDGRQRVLIWEGELQTDWWLSGSDAESLAALIQAAGSLDDVGRSLWAVRPAAEPVLARVRGS